VENACDGIMSPTSAGSFAFVGRIVNFTAYASASWAINMDCTGGAYTNIQTVNCWSVQLAGAPISGSKGFRFKNGAMLRLDSLFADYITSTFLEIDSCSGSIGEATLEAATYSQTSAGTIIVVSMSDSPMAINTLKFVSCSFTGTGGGEIYMFRPTSSGADFAYNIRNFNTLSNTYSGTVYEVVPGSGVRVYNEIAKLDRSVNFADFSILKKIRVWNGNVNVDEVGSNYVVYGNTAPPASETWGVGDIFVNSTPSRANPVKEWACVTAGTPGTWLPTSWIVSKDTTGNRPTAAANLQGVTYLDTTLDVDGKFIVCNGSAWVDATGAVV